MDDETKTKVNNKINEIKDKVQNVIIKEVNDIQNNKDVTIEQVIKKMNIIDKEVKLIQAMDIDINKHETIVPDYRGI